VLTNDADCGRIEAYRVNEAAMTTDTRSPDFLTIAEVASLLHVHRATLMNWRKAGVLRAYRLGPAKRLVRFRRQDIEALLREEER